MSASARYAGFRAGRLSLAGALAGAAIMAAPAPIWGAEAPPGAVVLARSPLCAVQAMRIGRHAYGMQYHCEILPRTVSDWAAIPTYACALDATLGTGAMPRLEAAAAAAMPDFNRDARRLYRNFMKVALG